MSFVVPSVPLHGAATVFTVLLAVVLVAPLVARRLRVPDLVVLLLLGTAVGPAGLGVLQREGAVALLGGAGLLYLMFLAGLELDLDDFVANRAASLRFGVLTFLLPLGLGIVVALALGFSPLASVLLGSCWSSHTLLAYPQFRAVGTAGHRAVATTVGATIITDTAALLVLAVVVRAHLGALEAAFWLTLLPSFTALVVGTLWGLPRLARRFFAGPGQDPLLRLLFVLLCLFVVAGLTEVVGIEPIVGAFLAGLALNRAVPNGGALMERVELLGSTLLVPLFLVATGMLVDVRVLLEPRTLVWGLAFTATAITGKFLASLAAGRLDRADATEVGAMFALSNAQAAATLAAVVVGLEAGILGDGVLDAVVLVVLVTCVVASLVAGRVAQRLAPDSGGRALGRCVVVPVANPASTADLLTLAAGFAAADGGVVVPVVVAPTGAAPETIAAQRGLLADAVRLAQADGAEALPTLRVDTTASAGITHACAEVDGSLLVLGWRGLGRTTRLGGIADLVLDAVEVPTLLVHHGAEATERVLVVLDGSLVRTRGHAAVALGLRAATVLARRRRAPVEVVTTYDDPAVAALVVREVGVAPSVVQGSRAAVVAAAARPGDLVVLPSLADARSLRALGSGAARAVPAGASTLVALARGARAAAELGEAGSVAGERGQERATRGPTVAAGRHRR